MHELSLAEALVEQIVQTAEAENAQRITRIVVVIGALSGVERTAFEFAFPLAVENTLAAGAELEIEETTAAAECNQCHLKFTPHAPPLVCENCGSDQVSLTGGRELMIRSVELEIPDSPQTS